MGTVGIVERARKEKEMWRGRECCRGKRDRDRYKKKVIQVGEMEKWSGEIQPD